MNYDQENRNGLRYFMDRNGRAAGTRNLDVFEEVIPETCGTWVKGFSASLAWHAWFWVVGSDNDAH
jgi:hypothetical protein